MAVDSMLQVRHGADAVRELRGSRCYRLMVVLPLKARSYFFLATRFMYEEEEICSCDKPDCRTSKCNDVGSVGSAWTNRCRSVKMMEVVLVTVVAA
ncbi:hypothetical protein DEO72_LG1g2827 [Vigna unguiculata]|uniref:Uncharacterized protein n=1 Tax=Vigna unguiculata TaxID=3917 RepID=A0A4D6KNE9_VIGUN|nr:hypothetical protein DEO72_LG1g2827 [Vigna unguiculata]